MTTAPSIILKPAFTGPGSRSPASGAGSLGRDDGLSMAFVRPRSSVLRASRITIGIRGAVAAVEPNLVRPMRLRPLDEEFRIERNAARGLGVELHHPAVDSIGIELRVDGAVERVGEIHPFAVPADLDHLRAAAERAVLGARMARARD